MARLRPNRLGAAFAALLVLFTLDLAYSEEKCRSGCQGVTPNTFRYAEGTTYKYNLEGNIDISLSSAEGQETSTKLRATVLLTQLPQCNQLLRLQNVQVIGPDAKKYGHLANIEKPIRINFHDGHIEDIICAEPGDNQNSLNIKRAVASLFQAALKHNHETDVFGLCPTDISTRKSGNILFVQKSRNLNKCAYRESVSSELLATTFNLHSEIKSSPLLNGDYVSEQQIKNGILEKALVTEQYLYLPFSVGKHGVKATVSTKLQLVGQSKEAPNSKVTEPKSIIFDNPHPVTTDKVNIDSILTALRDATNSIQLTVGETSAAEFLNLIKTLRVSSKNDILAVFRQVKAGAGFQDKEKAKRLFLDALFRAGSGESIEVAVELLKNKELMSIEQTLLYIRLAFVGHATPGSLNAVASLLDQPDLPRDAYLSIGSLAGKYCRTHSCVKADALNKLVQKLISKVKGGKPANREEERSQLYALKALANIGFLTDPAAARVIAIAQDKKEPNRLRVAALDTLQSDACKDKIRDAALAILKDIQQDSEIRIKAYLVLAQCPNGKVANALKALLDSEPSYQVGGFIVSHLRNLRASVNPDKELARQQLSQIGLPKRFPLDPLKYSFNSEFSYAIDTLGISSAVESNVIYSQDSFLPRSLNLNLTADLFGHSVNFLELTSRQENLDKVLEHYFGPLGVLRSSKPEELFAKTKNKAEDLLQKLKEKYSQERSRRSVSKSEVNKIEKDIQIKTSELNKDLDLDYSIKMFGSELAFMNINEDISKLTPEVLLDRIVRFPDKLIEAAKKFEGAIQSNILFLDTELSYPTSLGYPLRLAAEGVSSIRLKAAGSVDLQSTLSDSADKHLKLQLIPSANIEIAGSLYVDAQVIENGLKVKSTLYTATGSDLDVEISKVKGIDVKFSLPVQNQKIISASHQILFNSRELGKKEVNKPLKFASNKDFMLCVDNLEPYIGLTFCADINSPSQTGKQASILPFPLNGNAKLSVGIDREDLSLFHLKSSIYSDARRNGVDFVFEVLGEKQNRKLSIEAEAFVTPEKYIRASLDAPDKKINAEARITDNNNEKSLSGKFQIDQQQYFGKIGVSTSGSPARATYKPLFAYNYPGGSQSQQTNVEGAVIVEKNGDDIKYIFDNVKLNLPNQKSVILSGSVGREGPSYTSDLRVSEGNNRASLKGKFQITENSLAINSEFQNNVNPQANVNFKLDFKKSPNEYDYNLQIIHGQDLSSKVNRLTLSGRSAWRFVKDTNDFSIEYEERFAYPALPAEASFKFKNTPKTLEYDFDFKYNQFSLGSELELEVSRKNPGDYDLEFELYGLGNKFELKSEHEVDGDTSKIDNEVVLNDKKAEVKGVIKQHFKPEDIDIGADLIIKVSTRPEPIKLKGGLVLNPDEIDASLKINAGSSIDVDIFLKGNKAGNANGNLKVLLKGLLIANGQIKANKGAGNANLIAEVPKLNKKLKADTTFKIADPIYNVLINVYPDINKDPQNKYTLSTENKIERTAVDSRNYLEILGKRLETNVRASFDGEIENGKGKLEVEIVLPTDHYLSVKYNRDMRTVNDILNGNSLLVIEQRDNRNTPGRKFTKQVRIKDANTKKDTFDYTVNLALDLGQGKNLNSDIILKHLHDSDDKHSFDSKFKVFGSLLSSPLELNTYNTYKNRAGNYKITSSYGQKASLNIQGNFDAFGQGKPVSGDISIEIQTPSAQLKTIKFSSSGSAKKPENPDDYLELKGEVALFADDDGSNPGATVEVKGNAEVKLSRKAGKLKGNLNYQKEPPVSVAFGYDLAEAKDGKQINANLELKSGKGRDVSADLTIGVPNENEYTIYLLLDSPEARNSKFHLHSKQSADEKSFKNEGSVEVNNKKYVFANELVLSETVPALSLELQYPDGKKDEIIIKLNKISSNKGSGELKIALPTKDFLLELQGEGAFENVDNFNLKITANSPNLKIDNVALEAQSKAAKGGNRIIVSATSNGQNVLSGSTSYRHRVEGNKVIVEGSGSFKVKNENKPANFKYVRKSLSAEKDGEQGLEISLNAGLGSRAIDGEFKLTNKHLRFLNSYCEEKKQCSHIELDSKINTDDVSEFNHEIEIAVDLRNIGFSHEFGLKGVTNRKDFAFVHTVDVHFQNKNNKYQYSVYLQPSEAGASLTTPKRVVAAEAKLQLPKEKGKVSPIKADVSFYFDKKNQPTQKTSLSGILVYDHNKDNGNVHSELKFSSPSLGKDLQVLYSAKYDIPAQTANIEVILDVFAKANQKIVITGKAVGRKIGDYGYSSNAVLEMKSQGLKLNIREEENLFVDLAQEKAIKYSYVVDYNVDKAKYNSALQFEANQKRVSLLIRALNRDLANINSQLQLSKEAQVIDSNVEFLGVKPYNTHLELKNFNTLKFLASRKESPANKLEVNAGLIPGQISDFRVEILKNGARSELLHATVKLDESNFLKSDYGINSENIRQELLTPLRLDGEAFIKEVKETLESVTKDVSQQLKHLYEIGKKGAPNFKPFIEYHKNELEKLREEFVSDKTLKELEEFLKGIFGATISTINEIAAQINEAVEKITATLHAQFANIVEIINKDILPKLKEIAKSLLEATADIADKFINLFFTYLAKLSQLIDAHQEELKQIATSVSAIGQDILNFLARIFEQTRTVIVKESEQIYNEIKALPITEELKNRYNELTSGLTVSDGVVNALKDIAATLKDGIPNENIKKVITEITNYLEKKLKQEPVDDAAAIENIIKSIVEAVKAILTSLQNAEELNVSTKVVPLSFDFIHNLPRLVAIKFSPLNYGLKNEVPDLLNLLRLVTFNPRDFLLPQRLHGIIAQGQHIFTFDGKHFTFPGNCNYLLAGDAVNGNFTLIGTYTDGILTAISLSDDKDVVTVKKGRQALLNNAPAELPIHTSLISAFNTYETVHLISKAGVSVICGPELFVCGVHVSGFYHGQLKGLLGNGNSEPYDDLTLPNDKIVTSESDFGNAYKTSASCPNVKAIEHTHDHHHNEACRKLFGPESSLRLCTLFVDPENYKEACDHGLAAGVPDTLKAISVAYTAACNHKNIWTHIPDEYIKCENADKPYDVFSKFSVKLPGKAADIVLVVDQNKENEDIYKNLVQPLVTQLSHELNAKGISDIEYHVIGYGGESGHWPVHVTSNGKMTFKGKVPNLKFSEPPKKSLPSTDNEKLDSALKFLKSILHDISLVTGHNTETFTYKEALKYPFRANAVKSIIVARSYPCQQGRFVALQKLSALLFENEEISLNLITPFENLKLKDPKQVKNIIGFNSRYVFTTTDAKKKQGSAALHKELFYDDFCVDFTLNQRGNVFVSNNFLQLKGAARKQFVQTAAYNVAQQLIGIEQGLDCECKSVSPYSAINVCESVYTKELAATPRKGSTKG